MEVGGPGGIVSSGERLFYVSLDEEEQRTMLLDLSSLRSEIGRGLTLADIPPGNYQIQMKSPYIESNSVAITLQAATEKQLNFVHEVAAKLSLLSNRNDTTVDWSQVLRKATNTSEFLSPVSLSSLEDGAKQQLSFHLFLLSVLSSQDPLRDLEKLRNCKVPPYLTPDKESVLLELRAALTREISTRQTKAVKQFLDLHPDLRWRIIAAKTGQAEFAPYLQKSSVK